ncbi:MAG: hypothetical protein GY926_12770 [bacterium]|nr:hypothetical protein [bacterium]MCP4966093.1 hypothetical protein [bacterium]
MNPKQEQQLRARVSDLVMDWHESAGATNVDEPEAEQYESLIKTAAVVADESEKQVHDWVGSGKRAGLTWADIGAVLGISRQAAQQRFAPATTFMGVGTVGAEEDGLIVRSGLNAFNEVAVMDDEGSQGNELVGAAPFKLYFTPRDGKWENKRITALRRRNSVIKQYEDEGWTHAFTWSPFVYLTRRGAG